jgi:magnesium transporter
MTQQFAHLDEPVLTYARKDFAQLQPQFSVAEALAEIRRRGIGEKVVYFYVVDEQQRLVGVLPTRRLLTSALDRPLREIMIDRVVVLPASATILEACEMFVLHKYLAFPVVDEQRRILGIVDVSLFTEEVLDLAGQDQTEDLFETLGFHIAQVRSASPWRAFRLRFPWLLATIGSGLACALLASVYEHTLAKSILLTFFLTLVLALGESVSIQSMALAVQALRAIQPSAAWFLNALRREAGTALLLGGGCGALVALVILVWRGTLVGALIVGASIFVSLCGACLFGLSVPALLHRLKLDPKIAAGPVTLALTDVFTLFCYFSLGTFL